MYNSCHVKKLGIRTSDWQKERQETSTATSSSISSFLNSLSFFLTFNFHFWKFSSGVWNYSLLATTTMCTIFFFLTSTLIATSEGFSEMTWFSKPSNFSAGFNQSIELLFKAVRDLFPLLFALLHPPKHFFSNITRLSSIFFMIKKKLTKIYIISFLLVCAKASFLSSYISALQKYFFCQSIMDLLLY